MSSNCRTCQKLRVPDGSQLSVQMERSPSRGVYTDLCHAFPSERYCHCQWHQFAAYMSPPQTIILAQPQPSATGSDPATETPAVCPPVLTVAEEFVASDLGELGNLQVACPDQFAVGCYVIFPGRGYCQVAAIDASIKTLTLRNKTIQPGLRIPKGTRIYVLADIGDLFLSWLIEQFNDPDTTMVGGRFLAVLPTGELKAISAPPGTMLIGGEGGFHLVQRSGNLVIPASQSRANLTASGSITPTPPTTDLTINRVQVSMILRNTATDVSQSFTVDEESIEVPKASAMAISRTLGYVGLGSLAIAVPAENAAITNIRITGFEVSL